MTLNDSLTALDAIRNARRKDEKHPYWQTLFDFFLEEATPDERRILIDIVSKDERLNHGNHNSRLSQEMLNSEPAQYFRYALVSMLLNNGGYDNNPCALPRNLNMLEQLVRIGIKDQPELLANTLQEVAPLGSPRMRDVLLNRVVDDRQFRDYGDLNCNAVSSKFLMSIKDPQIRQLFAQLTVEDGYYIGWEAIAEFYYRQATETQRQIISNKMMNSNLYKSGRLQVNLKTENPRKYIEVTLLMLAIRSSDDWETNMYVLGDLQQIARENNLDFNEIAKPIYDISPEIVKKQLKNKIEGVE